MPSVNLIKRGAHVLADLAALTRDLPRSGVEGLTLRLEHDASSVTVRLSAILRGSMEQAEFVAADLRETAARRGLTLFGGAGFDVARTDLEPDQQRILFACPVHLPARA